ncbi:MAG: hypothetical protein WD649_04155 [Thermoleophilaceae bacterium]
MLLRRSTGAACAQPGRAGACARPARAGARTLPVRACTACLLAAALTLSGCFLKPEAEREGEAGIDFPAREGLSIPLDGIEYNVFITRELNTAITPDDAYYDGPPAPPGTAYFGVFIQACNHSDEPRTTVREFKLKDNREDEFEPKELPPTNTFAYNPRRLDPGQCIPAEGSATQLGPTAGAMLMFELPLAATENRPVELEILSDSHEAKGKHGALHVELDL